LTIIPKILREHINNSYPAHVCLIGTVRMDMLRLPPRGSTTVFDDEHFALWERGRGSTNANLANGSNVTIFFRKPPLRESGLLPRAASRASMAPRKSTSPIRSTRKSGSGSSSRKRRATRRRRASASS
jgi:hypothetical protein